jgi:hypothetical protein
VLCLLRLHPAVLDFLRKLPVGPDASRYTERRLRPLLQLDESQQLRNASVLLHGFRPPQGRGRTG